MKLISVVKSSSEKAKTVWFDTITGLLYVSFGSIFRAVKLELIPHKDFESDAEISRFSIGQRGSVVVCHHADGEETWLPVDMWDAGGFTPSARSARGRKPNLSKLPNFSLTLIEARRKAGLTQPQAARLAQLPPRTLQEWEQGRQRPPQDRISKVLEILAASPQGISFSELKKKLSQPAVDRFSRGRN